jgi:RNA polymerase sigma-70 factor (ECF subfamily)
MKKRTDDDWLRQLRSEGPGQTAALADLRAYLVRAATYALHRNRSNAGSLAASVLGPLAEDCAQDALLAILKNLDRFRGDSRFTTWAFAFAVNAAMVAVRRERWKRVPLDALLGDSGLPPEPMGRRGTIADPLDRAEESELLDALRQAVERDLTERQRQALKAVVFDGVPLDEVARYWGSNRNAVYKLLHDARRRLKRSLQERGFNAGDVQDRLDRTR